MSERNSSEMSPFVFSNWEYFQHLKNHKQFIIVFTLSAMLCALALTYVYSEKYEATTTLFFSPEEIIRLKFKAAENEAFGAPMPGADFKVVGKTLENLATNEMLLRRVVNDLELDVVEETEYTGPAYIRYYKILKDNAKEYVLKAWSYLKYGKLPDEDPTVNAVLELAGNIEVRAQDSYIFVLKARDRHPERAALIIDTVAAYLVNILEEKDKGPAVQRIEQIKPMLAQKRAEIDRIQSQLDELFETNNLTSVTQEMDRGLEQLYELTTQKTLLEADMRQNERELATLDSKLSLKGGGSRSSGLRPDDFEKMATDKLYTEIELDGQRARHASLAKSIRDIEAKLQKLPELDLTVQSLENELHRANDDYSMLNVVLQELNVREADATTELKIQHPATVPTAPVSPIKVYHVGLAGILGIFFSIGLAYLFAYFNIRLFVPSKGVKKRAEASPATPDQPPPNPMIGKEAAS